MIRSYYLSSMKHNTITDKDIKTAIRFAKVHAKINVPLKRKVVDTLVVIKRAQRASKLWASMFGYLLEG